MVPDNVSSNGRVQVAVSGAKKNRLLRIFASLLGVVGLYFAVYLGTVRIEFRYSMAVNGHSEGTADAYYAVGPIPQVFAQQLFEPARLCDVYYLRPSQWEDRNESQTP